MNIVPIDYNRIPEHMRASMQRYVEHGAPTGDFLFAILTNNFMETFARADEKNTKAMHDWAKFIYNELPSQCHGSIEKVLAWHGRGGRNGEEETRS